MTTTELGTEVWYAIEVSAKGSDDWYPMGTSIFSSMITAKSKIDREYLPSEEYEYRMVKVTTTSEVVSYD